jgi:hypothetical protein
MMETTLIYYKSGLFLIQLPCSSLCCFNQFKCEGFSIFGFLKGITIPKHSCKKKNTHFSISRVCVQFSNGGEDKIRTCGWLPNTRFPSAHFRPLGHLSKILNKIILLFCPFKVNHSLIGIEDSKIF